MPIDIYLHKFSPPCRALMMTLKHLNIDYNPKIIDMSEGQNMTEEYLKLNPNHTIPTMNDNGFVLWESRAIMQYLCNQYVPDSLLYPKDPKQRALVDRWLNFDLNLFLVFRAGLFLKMFGIQVTEQAEKALQDNLKLLNQLIGDKKYLVGDQVTLADLSVLATTWSLISNDHDLTEIPNFKRYATTLSKELPYFEEINYYTREEVMAFAEKRKALLAKNKSGN